MRIILALSFLLSLIIVSNTIKAQNGGGPVAYDEFYDAGKMKQDNGQFTIYKSDYNYYLEISEDDLGKDILITTQIVGGYDSYVSPKSGIIQFKKGRNNTLELYKNLSNTFPADNADFCMMQSIQKSGLVAPERIFPIVAMGKDKKSVIIDLTGDLNNPAGLFDVTTNGNLSIADPSRSRLEGHRMIEGGVVFTAIRTATQYVKSTAGTQSSNTSMSFRIEMLIQRIPDHQVEMKKDHPAYGFETVERVEYDTRNYQANTVNFVKRWNLVASKKNQKSQAKGEVVEPEMPIQIWIDPITPDPFKESVHSALKQWEKAFEKAGWKNVFKVVNDRSLSYKKIVFFWGNAYTNNNKYLVTEELNGEILAGRINMMDESSKNAQPNYVLWCGLSNSIVKKERQPLELRKQILTSKLAGILGEVLGVKPNYPAITAFSPSQLRNAAWLKKSGPTASVIGAPLANYLVQPEDGIDPELMFPKVSVYDNEAIDYLYGDRTESPSILATYYAESDNLDPYAQVSFLSNDLIKASKLGINNLSKIYPQIPEIVSQWPGYQNTPEQISLLAKQAFSIYQFFVNQMSIYVGGRSKRAVIRGENEDPITYISKAKQEEALNALEKYAFSGMPEWYDNAEINRIWPVNTKVNAVNMATGVMQNLMRKEVFWSLADAENEMGDKAFTCRDLFNYFNRVFFHNFDPTKQLNEVELNIQLQFAVNLVNTVNTNNITGGLTDVSAYLNVYLIEVRDHIKKMMEYKSLDKSLYTNCELILLKMNKEFFNKTI